MKHQWTIVCQQVLTNSETNNLSLIDVIEQVNIPAPPPSALEKFVLPLPFEVVSCWTAEPREDRNQPFSVSIEDAKGHDLNAIQGTFTCHFDQGSVGRAHTRVRVGGFPVSGEGYYHVVVRDQHAGEWREAARIGIQVFLGDPAEELSGTIDAKG